MNKVSTNGRQWEGFISFVVISQLFTPKRNQNMYKNLNGCTHILRDTATALYYMSAVSGVLVYLMSNKAAKYCSLFSLLGLIKSNTIMGWVQFQQSLTIITIIPFTVIFLATIIVTWTFYTHTSLFQSPGGFRGKPPQPPPPLWHDASLLVQSNRSKMTHSTKQN